MRRVRKVRPGGACCARFVLAFGLLAIGACVSRPVIPILDRNVIASGTLEHHALTNDLFRIDDFWMRVTPDTEFHRWLSQGVDRHVSISLTTTPERYGDSPNVRILAGTLIHNTSIDEMVITHILYVQDPETRALSPITFETVDTSTARKWDGYDNGEVSVVIKVG